MKTLIRKEWRELAWLAALGLGVLTLIVGLHYLNYRSFIHYLANGLAQTSATAVFQPLVAHDLQAEVLFFCTIFAAVIGWMQIFNERPRDLWAFFRHRPVTPEGLFLSKVIAGLGLYFVATGIPLGVFILWAAWPGHVAAPFHAQMLLPFIGSLLAGVPLYFAGMLTGLRQARWYVSRALGLGAGLVIIAGCIVTSHFSLALATLAVGTGMLALAAWGTFRTNGEVRGQPILTRWALALVIGLGWVVVIAAAAVMLGDVVSRTQPRTHYDYYVMLKTGEIGTVKQSDTGSIRIVDQQGKPVVDPGSGEPLTQADLHPWRCTMIGVSADSGRMSPNRWPWPFRAQSQFFVFNHTLSTIWYYFADAGRLVAYDTRTRRPVGSMGPDGFAPNLTGNGDRFQDLNMRTFRTGTALFDVDIARRSVREIFRAAPDDRIFGVGDSVQESSGHPERTGYRVVMTSRSIHLLSSHGERLWTAPYDAPYPGQTAFSLCLPEVVGQYVLWASPAGQTNAAAGWSLPTHVTWFQGEQPGKRVTLPPLERWQTTPGVEETVLLVSTPPALLAALAAYLPYLPPWTSAELVRILLMSLGFSLVLCVPVAWWISRRYQLSPGARLAWLLFVAFGGLAGLLALICVEEWPAREPCPNCRQPRVVDKTQCPHCQAAFAPPAKKGTEVFEPLGVGISDGRR